MISKTVLIALLITIPLSVAAVEDEKPLSPAEADKATKLFEEGCALFEKGEHKKALVKYRASLAIAPKGTGALYNGGLCAYLAAEYETAADLFGRLKEIDPADWMVRAKLVQTWQALGKKDKRDAERKELYDLRKKPESKELRKKPFFCRDQFPVADCQVMVFEHFELKGDRAVRFLFAVTPKKGERFRITLGSYKTTNDLAVSAGRVKKGQRCYHLDGYFKDLHELYGMYNGEPGYDDIRKQVIEILEKKRKALAAAVKKDGEAKDTGKKIGEKKPANDSD